MTQPLLDHSEVLRSPVPPLSKESRGHFFVSPASAGTAFVSRWLCPDGLESARHVAGAMCAGAAWAAAVWNGSTGPDEGEHWA
jgi:hypothetical protein